ncbi:hypothetical protein K435DRAFT_142809 [Dendrothele bispora CBS 962.96]|uniref:Uncharacterized protein n=1 Tax=Dendrothele bispora (strain CBS 962.96) TaxID=1314807 RepID=A0A4S8LZ16_DENBC|nr:hypothetical protein K435DRAFT_142809 [Dendrothele bispora CBS 962.96]
MMYVFHYHPFVNPLDSIHLFISFLLSIGLFRPFIRLTHGQRYMDQGACIIVTLFFPPLFFY